MKAYISGPISGTSDFRERFRRASERLTKLEIDFVNPAELYKVMPGASEADYIAVCKRMLSTCQMVILLPGFADSKGCMEEFALAKRLGIPLFMDIEGEPPNYDKSVR